MAQNFICFHVVIDAIARLPHKNNSLKIGEFTCKAIRIISRPLYNQTILVKVIPERNLLL